jgi:hypothetical protein
MDLVRRVLGRNSRPRIDPNAPHPFRPIDDVAMAATGDVLGGGQDPGQAAVLALATDALRDRGCLVRGCGRPADDPIHT